MGTAVGCEELASCWATHSGLGYLRLKVMKASPLSTLHISGVQNAMTDIPSRSFGTPPKWHCQTENDLLTMFNSKFPLPNQASWTGYQVGSKISTLVLGCSLQRWKSGVNCQSEENTLASLGRLRHTFGIGPLLTGHHVPPPNQSTYGICGNHQRRAVQ